MANDFDSFVDDLMGTDVSDLQSKATKATDPKYARKRFTCEACGGSGLWRSGQSNKHGNAKCNTCHGKGYLVTDPKARAKAKVARQTRKLDSIAEARMANQAHGEGALLRWLGEIETWNDFARSMLEQHRAGRAWSEKQVAACRRMYAKMQEDRRARKEAAEVALKADPLNLEPIRAMFEKAVAAGLKRPTYRAEGLVISRAPDTGRNPGALYVKNADSVYGGKVLGTELTMSREGRANDFTKQGNAYDALFVIAENPLAAAVKFGHATGRCACCNRPLTNAVSVKRGIGPICAERYGLEDVQWGIDRDEVVAELQKELGR